MNALGYVGVGTLVTGKYRFGGLQLRMALVAALLGVIGLFASPWLLLAAMGLYGAAFAWALATSIALVMEAARQRHARGP